MTKYFIYALAALVWSCSGKNTTSETSGEEQTEERTSQNLEAQLFYEYPAILGEGAFWDARTQELLWVDIMGEKAMILKVAGKINRALDAGSKIGTIVPSTDLGKAIVATESGIHNLNLADGALTLLSSPEDSIEGNRFNDGKCDPSGRFWVGSMALEIVKGAGSLYRYTPEGGAKRMIDSVTVSNGINWSHDGKRMYYIDSPTRTIKVYDFDDVTGEISNGKVLVNTPDSLGVPDGMTIDAAGNLWVAHWGGYCVACWSSETGELLKKIDVPAKQVTSCAFGGENFDTLFITTARKGLAEDELSSYPYTGSIFYAIPGEKGVSLPLYSPTVQN